MSASSHRHEPPQDLGPAIKAILANAARLADEAEDIGNYGRTQTGFFLSVLAREEYAKAFLLILAQEERLPWTTRFQDALRNHKCKQLVSHLLCELSAIDFFEPKYINKWPRRVRELPRSAIDALHILIHEQFGSLERDDWWKKDEDAPIDPSVHEIAAGAVERRKQDLLYVRIGWNGTPRNNPVRPLSQSAWDRELCRLKLVREAFWVSEGKLSGSPIAQYHLISALVRVLAGLMSPEEYDRTWA